MGNTQIWGQSKIVTQTGHITPTNKQTKTHIQQIVVTLLNYERACDSTMLLALWSIASYQDNRN